MESKAEKIVAKVATGVFIGWLAFLIIGTLIATQVVIEGFLIRDCWRWLILPYFSGLPTLDWKAAVSLSLMWHALSFKAQYPHKGGKYDEIKRIFSHFLGCLLIYGMAYAIHRWL